MAGQPQPGYHAWPHGGVVAPPQYEFTQEENEDLAYLATWCGGLGILKLMQTVLGFVGRNLLGALFELAVGLTLLGSRKALRAAVDTAGNDVDHLMVAVEKLATVFQIRLILALVGAVIVAIILVVILALVPT